MSVKNWTLAKAGELCFDCNRECEDVTASYILRDGTPVCDSHLEIRAEAEAEEDAIWEAEGRKVAQAIVADQVAAMEDHILDAFRNDLHRERGELVNLYTGADRKTKIADLDLVIGAVEEEQAKRAGLASSADILAAFAAL